MMQRKSQRGATMIIVLFVLLLVVAVGAAAVRQGILGLSIATNSQVKAMMQQTTDAVFFAIEQDNNNSAILQRNLSSLGMLGMVKSDSFLNKELVFCYRPKLQGEMFSLRHASVITWAAPNNASASLSNAVIQNNELGGDGFCRYQSNDFASSRDVMISQIAVKKGSTAQDAAFKFYPIGTDATTVKLDPVQPIRIIVTTIMPAAATRSGTWGSLSAQINQCFSNFSNEKSQAFPEAMTVTDCFKEFGIPYNQQVMDYAVVTDAKQEAW